MSAATPQQYHATFEFNSDARAVLDDLIERFGGPSFAPGQPDVTAFKCGQKSVIEHIVSTLAGLAVLGWVARRRVF